MSLLFFCYFSIKNKQHYSNKKSNFQKNYSDIDYYDLVSLFCEVYYYLIKEKHRNVSRKMLHVKHFYVSETLRELDYFTLAPSGSDSAIVARDNWPSLEPAKIIPSESSPRNFTGLRFVTQMTFRPTNSSGL